MWQGLSVQNRTLGALKWHKPDVSFILQGMENDVLLNMFIPNSDSTVRALLNQAILDLLLTSMRNKICILINSVRRHKTK